MSSKQQTDSKQSNTLNYDPTSLGNYQSLTGAGSNQLLQMMQNPFGNPLYQLGLGQSQKGAAQGGANNMSALQQMMRTSGIGGTAGQGFQSAQLAKLGRANQGMMAGANTSNVMNALQRQLQATGMGMSFSPLLKGTSGTSQSTQTTSGLGTWLPQLISAGLGAAAGPMGALMKPSANSTFQASQSMPSSQWGGASAFPGFSGFGGIGSAQGPPSTPPLQWGMGGGGPF